MCTLSLPSKQTRRARQGTCSRALPAVSGVEPKALHSSECPVHLQVWLLGLAFKALPCPLTSSLPTHQDSVLRSLGHIDQTSRSYKVVFHPPRGPVPLTKPLKGSYPSLPH